MIRQMLYVIGFGLVLAGTAWAVPSTLAKSGSCKLDEKTVVELSNADFSVTCEFSGRKAFGKYCLIAIPKFTNKAGRTFYISYNVSFFNKAGNLVASVSQHRTLQENKKDFALVSAQTYLHEGDARNITSYQLVVYAIDAE